jgi:hypothetical protein
MMSQLPWLFLSEILVTAMIWVFIVEFNEGFSRPKDLEDIIRQSILAKARANQPLDNTPPDET